jgi:tRNA G10  N-methylase Trm11
VEPGSLIADVTHGRGVFWSNVPEGLYRVRATDIKTGTDCRNLPYEDGQIDCVVLDPPYMHSPGGTAHLDHQNFEEYYRNNEPVASDLKYHDAVLDLYFRAADEARRVLRSQGIYIVKCQDEVCSNRQRLTHVEIINELDKKGFRVVDLLVVVRMARPGVSRTVHQVHARKNHSYFLVFVKDEKTLVVAAGWASPTIAERSPLTGKAGERGDPSTFPRAG